jgi:hypothetical protein
MRPQSFGVVHSVEHATDGVVHRAGLTTHWSSGAVPTLFTMTL